MLHQLLRYYRPCVKEIDIRRRGHLEKADLIANKINCMTFIIATCIISSDVGKLQALLRETDNWGSKNSKLYSCENENGVNNFSTSLVCDKTYKKHYCLSCLVNLMLMILVLQLKPVIMILIFWILPHAVNCEGSVFGAVSLCFLFVYEIPPEPLNGFAPN